MRQGFALIVGLAIGVPGPTGCSYVAPMRPAKKGGCSSVVAFTVIDGLVLAAATAPFIAAAICEEPSTAGGGEGGKCGPVFLLPYLAFPVFLLELPAVLRGIFRSRECYLLACASPADAPALGCETAGCQEGLVCRFGSCVKAGGAGQPCRQASATPFSSPCDGGLVCRAGECTRSGRRGAEDSARP